MSKDYKSLESYEWLGEFWLEGEDDKKFPGLLSYTPEKGISIKVLRKNADFPHRRIPGFIRHDDKAVTIFGYTQETGNVSLLDCMSTGRSSSDLYSTEESFFCGYAILDGHFSKSHVFHSCSLGLNNLSEFCHPQGFKMHDSVNGHGVCKSVLDKLSVSICKQASGFHVLDSRISSLLLDIDVSQAFMDELDSAVKSLSEKHDIPYLAAKSEIEYLISIESPDCMEFMDFMREAIYVRHFFSFLMLKKIVPLWMCLREKTDEKSSGYSKIYPVLMSLYLNEKQVKKIDNDQDNRLLPVNLQGIKDNFQSVYYLWREFRVDRMNIVLNAVLDHIDTSRLSIQEPAIMIAAMEQWFYKYSGLSGTKNDKYEKVINEYSSDHMKKRLEESIPFERDAGLTLGELITHVRAAILHPGSNAQLPLKEGSRPLDEISLANIAEMLYIIIVLGVYTRIGVSEEAISNVRESYDRFTAFYRSAQE